MYAVIVGCSLYGIILDIAVVVLFLVILLFSIWRGFYKMIFGLVLSLLAFSLAFALTSTVTKLVVDYTTFDTYLANALDKPLSKIQNNDAWVFTTTSESGEVSVMYTPKDNETEMHPFSDITKGQWYSVFGKTMENAVKKQLKGDDRIPFREALALTLTSYILSACVWVVLLILFTILVKLIMNLFKKFVTRSYFGHFANKALGAALGLAISMVLIWGSLAIIRLLATFNWIIPVNAVIGDSLVTKMLFNNNYVYTFVVNSFDVSGVLDKLMGGVSVITGKG